MERTDDSRLHGTSDARVAQHALYHSTIAALKLAKAISFFRPVVTHVPTPIATMALNSHTTRVLPIEVSRIGTFKFRGLSRNFLEPWSLELAQDNEDPAHLLEAAALLRKTDTPVAFPTETVYGLGADATRSAAVRGIYAAKQRPSDNPLIVHISSIAQLHRLLRPANAEASPTEDGDDNLIPSIYTSLITRFWPGPLTILLPLPTPSPLAPEVTASLPTFAVRMPSSLLALALIHMADTPLAAPSANASTRPSPTTAAHVLNDLDGRIDVILDGGPCDVGVESTVVDGLSKPPVILRPGGISIEMLRQCPGWEEVVVGYMDGAEMGVPRAPGMKYKHYSPRARVVLVEGGWDVGFIEEYGGGGRVGVLTTKSWQVSNLNNETSTGQQSRTTEHNGARTNGNGVRADEPSTTPANGPSISPPAPTKSAKLERLQSHSSSPNSHIDIWVITLGSDAGIIARGLFSALRELDEKDVDVILVEAIDDSEGDAAAAVMNRLRKAAEISIKR